MKGIFAIQSDIAKNVVGVLKVKLLAEEKQWIEKKGTENLEAYNLYLKGWYYLNKYTKEGMEKGKDYFNQAIEKDPTYAQAYVGLALHYEFLGEWGYLPSKEAYPKVEAAATKALELDNTNDEAYVALALVKFFYYRDWVGAESFFKRAIQLNPNSVFAHDYYGINYLSPMARHDEAIAEGKRAQELDPLTVAIGADLGWAYNHARRYDEGIEQCQKVLEMDPNFSFGYWCLGMAYSQKGLYEKAIATFQKAG
jgi:tetratricopeptide (TPR) repeat protein